MKKYHLTFTGEGPAYIAFQEIESGQVKSTEDRDGFLVDLDQNKKAIGIEIVNPANVTLEEILKIIEKVDK